VRNHICGVKSIITLEKKLKKQKILVTANTILKGNRSFSLDHFLRISSLFSKEILEKLRINGHLVSKHR
jgi:hypothetical protein